MTCENAIYQLEERYAQMTFYNHLLLHILHGKNAEPFDDQM